MATTTYDALSAEQRTFYELEMLPRAVPPFSFLHHGQTGISPVTQIPENKGDIINWRLLAPFTVVSSALTEGVTPNEHDISISSITAEVEEYGAFVRYTRKLAAMGIDKVAAEAGDALGEQAGDSLDQLVRDVVIAGTTVQYASTASSRATVAAAMKLTAAELLEALATLKTNKAQPSSGGKYVVLLHPYAEYDLYQDSVMQNVLYYSKERGESNPWTTGFIGEAFGMEFWSTPNAKIWVDAGATNADVLATLVVGKGAFGIGGLGAYMPQAVKGLREGNNTFAQVRPLRLIQKPFGSAGSEDPLEQRATIAWYTTFVSKILTQNFMVRIEHAATLSP